MALKHTITKAEYDKLSDELKAEYEKKGDGYVLDVEGLDDPDELRRARDREKEEAKKLKRELKEAREKLAEIEGDDARKTGDIEKIDNAWKEKLAAKETELGDKLSKKDQFIRKSLIDATADALAAKISTTPKLLSKAIRERLTVDFDGDEPELIVIGADGKPDRKLGLDKLEKEFVANPEYAAIIIGHKASGGGAPRKDANKPSGAGGSDEKPNVDLSKLSGKALADYLKAKREAEAET